MHTAKIHNVQLTRPITTVSQVMQIISVRSVTQLGFCLYRISCHPVLYALPLSTLPRQICSIKMYDVHFNAQDTQQSF